jgi:thiol-disulfide isomerase/thioredoxin
MAIMKFQLTALALILGLIAGCTKTETTPEDAAKTDSNKTDVPAISVSIQSAEELQKVIAGHKGKIVVVDLWARTSEPSLEQLPELQELQEKFPDDVVAISLNLEHNDDVAADENLRKKVLAKLTELNMKTVNVVSSTSQNDVLDSHGLFSLPAAIVYDGEGEFLKCFDGDLDFESQIVPLVEETLAASKDDAAGPADDGANPQD